MMSIAPVPAGRSADVASRRVRLALEQPVETANAIGGAAISWQPVVTLWARIEAASGRERERAARAEGVTETRITLRWRGAIDTTMRFALGSRRFAIRGVFDPDGRRRNLVCFCEEVSP